MALAFFAILSIFIPFADGLIKKRPWDFEKWEVKGESDNKVVSNYETATVTDNK